jgi:TrmH family RNA methyltransferase
VSTVLGRGGPGGPRRFRTGDPTSLAIGLWPVLEALRHRPRAVERVAWHPDLAADERARLLAAARAAGVPAEEDATAVARARRAGTALVVARVRRPDEALDDARDHVVLLQPAHAGNVGAALRTALGFGLRDVALVGGRVDPWSPHVLRASQGAAFALRHRAWGTWAGYRAAHPDHAVVAVTTPAPDAVPLAALAPPSPAAWTFGPEGGAFPAEALPGAWRTTIPQDPELESHNLAVAVGIALYARAQARGAQADRDPRPAARS